MDKPMICWDDVVFQYRNKDYGAYDLRSRYPQVLSISAWIVIGLFIIVAVGPFIFQKGPGEKSSSGTRKIEYAELKAAPPIEKIEVPKPAVAKYVAPKVTQEEVKPNEELPTIGQATAQVDNTPIETAKPVEEEKPVEVVPPPAPVEEVKPPPEPVKDVIIDPQFPGGLKECSKWLQKHLEYPAMAVRMGIEGKVVVQFTVDTNGKISNATVVQSLHRLCDQEALRLVKSMPDWTPGEKNGVKTTATYTLPISFVLN
jgi:periplasmic protein TonB